MDGQTIKLRGFEISSLISNLAPELDLIQFILMSFFSRLFKKTEKPSNSSVVESRTIYEAYKYRIYPWIKLNLEKEEIVEDTDRQGIPLEISGGDAPIFQPWLGDLLVFYVADMGHDFKMVCNKDLPDSVTLDELHKLAIKNLYSHYSFELKELSAGVYGLIADGNHEAGSICIPDVWQWLVDHLKDNLIVAVPAKDILAFAKESEDDSVNNLKIFVHNLHNRGERLLTRNIFKYDRETKGWSVVDKVTNNN